MAGRSTRRSTSRPTCRGSATRTIAFARPSSPRCTGRSRGMGSSPRSTRSTEVSVRVHTIEEVAAAGDLPWFAPTLERLRAAVDGSDAVAAGFLDAHGPIALARAPGRLDVMGGIADYSGALVLEMPLACATVAAAQRQDPRRLEILSVRADRPFRFDIDLDALLCGNLSSPESLAAWFADRPDDRWA